MTHDIDWRKAIETHIGFENPEYRLTKEDMDAAFNCGWNFPTF